MSHRDTTLVFLVKKTNGVVHDICLAMKKRGFGVGRWNGAGGKVENGESVEDAARREAAEELGVAVMHLEKIGELLFTFPHRPVWNQKVHVYFTKTWEGEPQETEEMRPAWFSLDSLPFTRMWADDIHWIPHALDGKRVRAAFTFNEKDEVVEKVVRIVGEF